MKFSIFTASHDLKNIDKPLNSLKKQTFKDFEWVILLNGNAVLEYDNLIERLKNSNLRFNVLTDMSDNKNIGYLKKECCKNADGEILVELDHDDELTPDCLEELENAFRNEYDFCYSDDYYVEPVDGKDKYITPFNSSGGWKIKVDKDGNKYPQSFPPSALSFSYIWYAPDHVRAWKKDFYEKIGGHNKDLDVCDDYDLMCRSYILGKCHRIDKPLYKYYAYPDRTSAKEKNEKIQELTHVLHDKYILDLASKWSSENNLKKVDLCCGQKPVGDFIGIDKKDFHNGSIVYDLDKPNWPFESGSVGVFRAWNALNGLRNPIQTMKEIYRCLADYGWVIIDMPSTDGRGAFQNPNNVSYWNTNSFWYYTKHDFAKEIGVPVKFQLNRIYNYFPSEFERFHNIVYAKAHLVKLPEKGFEIPIHGREI